MMTVAREVHAAEAMSEQPQSVEPEPLRFERESCSRCRGVGKYSWCERWGDICFRCKGKGETLTKRGAAAAEYFRQLRLRRASTLKPGDRIRDILVTFGGEVADVWYTVVSIAPDPIRCSIGGIEHAVRTDLLVIKMVRKSGAGHDSHGIPPESMYEVAQSPEAHAKMLRAAIEYQATLTKAGTIRRIRKARTP